MSFLCDLFSWFFSDDEFIDEAELYYMCLSDGVLVGL